MRTHAVAAMLVGASAAAMATSCGETLPAAEEVRDAAAEMQADAPSDSGCTLPCNAEVVATARPAAIAASGAAMVWLQNANVFLLDPGNAPVTLMEPPNGTTGYLAIDDVTVLMTEPNGVRRCPTTGGCDAKDPSSPIYQLSETGPVAAGGGEIFVTERAGARRLVTCGLGSNCNTSPTVVAYLPDVANKLALTTSFAVVGLGDQTIRAYLRAGRPDGGAPQPTPLATVVDLRGLASDGTFVYWSDGVGGTIGGCDVGSCAATTTEIASMRATPRALAVSAGKLYWVETNSDFVLRCALPACADLTVIARVSRPTDLAVGDRVYVASETEQKIYATAR